MTPDTSKATKEEGESAKTVDRTELQNLLKYCRTHKGKVHFVVVYNLTRFAREKYDYFALRAHLKSQQTLAQIDRHSTQLEEIDVEGILAFAERILPRASELWVQASLDQKQRLQQLFYPEGIGFDGIRFNRTAATAPLSKYLEPAKGGEESLVGAGGIEPPTPRV